MIPQYIVFVSRGGAFAHFCDALQPFDTVEVSASQRFMGTLVERRPALVFVDARHQDWRALILTGKSSAATRRIPFCLVSDDVAARNLALNCGADLALSWPELEDQIAGIVSDFARVIQPATLEQLDCECAEPLPPLAAEGIRQFNQGRFYRQHDLFEELWLATESPVRDLYRAILQIGVAYYQIERGNQRGALKMLQRSVQWIYALPAVCQGVDVAQLRRDSYAVRAELQRLGPERLAEFDQALLKPVSLIQLQPPKT